MGLLHRFQEGSLSFGRCSVDFVGKDDVCEDRTMKEPKDALSGCVVLFENIGAGDVRHIDDKDRWKSAATTGLAAPFIEEMPQSYETQLGRWFKGGRELSGGQWQKIALSRAFMRSDADILVLDEPTAAMDASSEAEVFEHFRTASRSKMTILISHRFSTVRAAAQIIVIHQGRILERGTHESLLEEDGQYAHLFTLQAQGYK